MRRFNFKLRSLHRGLGATAALFVIILALTGIGLNHTTALKLDQRYLTWNWLLAHYGMDKIEADAIYLAGRETVSQFDRQVFINAKPVATDESHLVGAIRLDDLMVLAFEDGLTLISPEGELIERMGTATGIPPLVQNIGLYHGEPVLQTEVGMWRSDFMLDQWEKISLQGVSWSQAETMSQSLEEELARYFHGEGVTVERFILDVHNGHIIGGFGPWLLDLVSLLMTFLALTGLWLWGHRKLS